MILIINVHAIFIKEIRSGMTVSLGKINQEGSDRIA
jgi:hypothetical protein